jgi:succinoglycan biosynthesis protein ExoO
VLRESRAVGVEPAAGALRFHFFRHRAALGPWHVALAPETWLRPPVDRACRAARRLGLAWRDGRTAAAGIRARHRPLEAAEAAFAHRLIATLRPGDWVLADLASLADILDAAPAGVGRAVLTHAILHRRLASLGAAAEASALRGREPVWLGKADVVVAIQADDAVECRALAPRARVCVVPVGLPVVPGPAGVGSDDHALLFVGSATAANVSGLRWFLGEVWPRLRQADPACHLTLCGRAGAQMPALPAGVVDAGFVERLAPHYHRVSVVVVPLVQGSGLKVKLVEALAAGRPVVTTPVGLQGVEFLRDEGACIQAEGAEAFAAAVAALLADRPARARLG